MQALEITMSEWMVRPGAEIPLWQVMLQVEVDPGAENPTVCYGWDQALKSHFWQGMIQVEVDPGAENPTVCYG